MKYLVINADDFGNHKSIDRGIIYGMKQGVITSTSVMVTRQNARDVEMLKDIPNVSIGLHFEIPKGNEDIIEEFNKQVTIFTNLVGRKPDHIDSHKTRPKNINKLKSYLEHYSTINHTPIRDWGYAHLIDGFFGLSLEGAGPLDTSKITPKGLLKVLNETLKEGYNELMTHAGFVDNEVIASSSYNTPRETELESLLSIEFKMYLEENPDIKLISWKEVVI